MQAAALAILEGDCLNGLEEVAFELEADILEMSVHPGRSCGGTASVKERPSS